MTARDVPWEELDDNLRGFIGRRVNNAADAEDLVQRVLLQLHKGLGSLRDSDRLYACGGVMAFEARHGSPCGPCASSQ